MTLEEKLKRNETDDQIEIGQIVDDALNGDFGTILRLIINGIIAENLAFNYDKDRVSADRVLGRIEELSRLQDRLEICVEIKNRLLEQNKEDSKVAKSDTI